MTEFVCDIDKQYHSACGGSRDYEYGDKRCCIFHLPDANKNSVTLNAALESQLDKENYDFREVVFTEGSSAFFRGHDFAADVDFISLSPLPLKGGHQFLSPINVVSIFPSHQLYFEEIHTRGTERSHE